MRGPHSSNVPKVVIYYADKMIWHSCRNAKVAAPICCRRAWRRAQPARNMSTTDLGCHMVPGEGKTELYTTMETAEGRVSVSLCTGAPKVVPGRAITALSSLGWSQKALN